MSGFEMIELDASHWTQNMTKRRMGCMPQAMTQKVIDIEETIKSDHLYATDATAAAEEWCFLFKVPGIRRQTNGAFRWIMLNLVLGCSEALHLPIVNLTMRVFFHASEEIPFKSIYNCFSVDS